MPDYNAQVMDSMLPPEQSVSSCCGSSRMQAVQDGTGSGMVRHARSADVGDSPGASTFARRHGRGQVMWYCLLGYFLTWMVG